MRCLHSFFLLKISTLKGEYTSDRCCWIVLDCWCLLSFFPLSLDVSFSLTLDLTPVFTNPMISGFHNCISTGFSSSFASLCLLWHVSSSMTDSRWAVRTFCVFQMFNTSYLQIDTCLCKFIIRQTVNSWTFFLMLGVAWLHVPQLQLSSEHFFHWLQRTVILWYFRCDTCCHRLGFYNVPQRKIKI